MRVILGFVLAVAFIADTVITSKELVTVRTAYGKVRGFRVPLKDNADSTRTSASVFLGVPFAKPPVGDLRFEKPQPPDVWLNVREAIEFAAKCTPLAHIVMQAGDASTYSEDCLYLNVIAPNWKNKAEPKGFPVMVFIHGGGFVMGSAAEFGYKNFAEKYLPKGVIVVTVQYRLAQFGFLTINGTDLRGNYGLWDVIAALKFVCENIAQFGGDPDRITIFGHSAGAAAVGHLAMSPHSEGLFANAIEMSGSPFAEWATSPRTEASDALAKTLGCANAKSVKECLQQKTTDQLLEAVEKTGLYRRHSINFLTFVPHIDGDFFSLPLADSLSSLKEKRPLLIGVADSEGLAFTVAGASHEISDVFVPPENRANFDEASFVNAIRTLVVNEKSVGSEKAAEQLLQRIVDFYLSRPDEHAPPVIYNGATKNDSTFYIRQYTKVMSDAMFLVPVLIDAQEKAKAGWPVYLYRFGYINIDALPEPFRALYDANTHAGEYPYVFDIRYETKSIPFNADDLKFQENFLSTLIQFAKTGNPTTKLEWPQLTGEAIESLAHVELGSELVPRNDLPLLARTLEFWSGLRADFDFPEVWQFPRGQPGREEL